MRAAFVALVIVTLCHISKCETENDPPSPPIVKTPSGKIRGSVKESDALKLFSAFEGIPFAKPPVGDLRFKEPVPIGPWEGIWSATSLSECIQTGLNPGVAQGEEDCLYINVYVPRENPNPNDKLDVIVHIHGGAYMFGSGHAYAHPEYFMDKDVIFVTFNYRLGIFGFLSTEDKVVPGNNGLKDQVEALKWVQKNIASFGGNPNSVTLTGLSAGGCSTHLHYLSPLSKGLFHRGFSQSGVATNPWSLQEEPLKKAKQLASSMGCPDKDTKALVECLRQRPVKQILSKVSLFYGFLFMPFSPFAPVVEKGSKNPFLSKNPYYLLAKGNVQDLPWITSNTAEEGYFPGQFVKGNLDEINENWTDLAPLMLDFNYTLAKTLWKTSSEEIKEFYLGSKEALVTHDNFDKFVKMLGDRLFVSDAEQAVRLQAKANKSPVYYYWFGYAGDHGENKTVAHGADGQYLFSNMFGRKLSPNEKKMKEIMLDMLVGYAKTGTPNIGGKWDPTEPKPLTYLNISSYELEEIKLQTADELSPTGFWKEQNFLENQNIVLIKDEL